MPALRRIRPEDWKAHHQWALLWGDAKSRKQDPTSKKRKVWKQAFGDCVNSGVTEVLHSLQSPL